MTRIHDGKSGASEREFTASYVWRIRPPVNWSPRRIVQLECVCGNLLYIKEPVIELFHPSGQCVRDANELSCPHCLRVFQAMSRSRDNYRECVRNGRWCELADREVAE